MTRLVVTETIAAPPDQVFALATDLAGAADRIEGIESIELLTDAPFGMGTRWRETRRMFGKASTEEMWITAHEPGHSYTAEAESCGTHYFSTISCEPAGEGTRLAYEFRGEPTSIGGKVMGVLFAPLGWLMKRQLQALLAKDLADLRRAAEAATGQHAE